jgi:hypothetical protein
MTVTAQCAHATRKESDQNRNTNRAASHIRWNTFSAPPTPAAMIAHVITGVSARKSRKNSAISFHWSKANGVGLKELLPSPWFCCDILDHLYAYEAYANNRFLLEFITDDVTALEVLLGSVPEEVEIVVHFVRVEQRGELAIREQRQDLFRQAIAIAQVNDRLTGKSPYEGQGRSSVNWGGRQGVPESFQGPPSLPDRRLFLVLRIT